MAYFSALRQGIGNILSPAANKRPAISARSSSSSLREGLDRDRMSPTKRTAAWLYANSPPKKANTITIHRVRGSRVTKCQVATPKSTAKSVKSKVKFWERVLPRILYQSPQKEAEDEFEGSTLIEDDRYIKEEPSVDDNLEGDTILGSPQHELTKPPQKVAASVVEPEDKRSKEWSKNEVWLLEKLNLRGLEPLMDATWHLDFPVLAPVLFTYDPSRTFINSASDRDFRARRALNTLLVVGADARDRIFRSLTPEPAIQRDILAYQKWAIQDANLQRTPHIPLMAIAAAGPNETVKSVIARLEDQLHDMGRKYRHLFRSKKSQGERIYKHELPTFYGIMIKYSVVAFMTWDSTKEGQPVRNIGVFDLKRKGQDVWHGLAIAILVIRVRNQLIELRRQGWIGDELVDEDDPDA